MVFPCAHSVRELPAGHVPVKNVSDSNIKRKERLSRLSPKYGWITAMFRVKIRMQMDGWKKITVFAGGWCICWEHQIQRSLNFSTITIRLLQVTLRCLGITSEKSWDDTHFVVEGEFVWIQNCISPNSSKSGPKFWSWHLTKGNAATHDLIWRFPKNEGTPKSSICFSDPS